MMRDWKQEWPAQPTRRSGSPIDRIKGMIGWLLGTVALVYMLLTAAAGVFVR